MKKLNSNGFGAVEVLLVIVLVCALTGISWYVLKSKKSTDTNLDQAAQSANSTQNKLEKPTKDIKTTYVKQSEVDPLLISAIKKTYSKKAPACQFTNLNAKNYINLNTTITHYKAKSAALAGIGCVNSAVYLYGYEKNNWTEVASTQMVFDCKDLIQFNVPDEWLVIKLDPSDSDMKQNPAQCHNGTKVVEYKGV